MIQHKWMYTYIENYTFLPMQMADFIKSVLTEKLHKLGEHAHFDDLAAQTGVKREIEHETESYVEEVLVFTGDQFD